MISFNLKNSLSILSKSFLHAFQLKYFKASYCSEITAGVAIIGDEILKGITEDLNTSFLIKNLNSVGIRIHKIVILPDDVNTISKEIKELSNNCTVVLTSGGIGPTHDDVTYEAVAKACKEELKLNEELSVLFSNYFGTRIGENPAIIKFASVPASAILNFGELKHSGKLIKFPLVSVKNIYMFPGVPFLLQKCFEIFKCNFLLRNKPNFVKIIHVSEDEFFITPLLNETVKRFQHKITFGSYPTFNNNYFKVKIVLESTEEQLIAEAEKFIRDNLPRDTIFSPKEDILPTAKDNVLAYAKHSSTVASAIAVIEEALTKYSLREICFCFNGGKDCTALLHLLYACVQKFNPEQWCEMQTLYVKNGEPFREVENFVEHIMKTYALNYMTIEGDLKEATNQFLKTKPQIKAVFLGTRRSDPGAENLEYFCYTDSGWPSIMRVLPILDWSYKDVWAFIRDLQIQYCVLYDRGYTSLGCKSQTQPNPSLLFEDEHGRLRYKPAYKLEDKNNERCSRI